MRNCTYDEETTRELRHDMSTTPPRYPDWDGSRVSRYLLIEIDLPDGSGGTPDPEVETQRIEEVVRHMLGRSHSIEQVYPGDVVGDDGEDVEELPVRIVDERFDWTKGAGI